MDEFTSYCTPEQTKKAMGLGAPIKLWSEYHKCQEHDFELDTPIPCTQFAYGYRSASCPTTEQMIGWLEKQGLFVTTDKSDGGHFFYKILKENTYICEWNSFNSRPEATLAGIDAALVYLIQCKK